MAIPPSLQKGLKLPVIAAPMFLVSGPDLVIQACKSGIVGTFPALNQRTTEGYAEWLDQIKAALGLDDAFYASLARDFEARRDYLAAALQGSSFYKLPRLLQWFTGNIGFHHVHHISPRIPNYNLEACHKGSRLFREVRPLTLRGSLKSLSLRLWDEPARRLVGFA